VYKSRGRCQTPRAAGVASAKAHHGVKPFQRSAEALLPPHKCGGSHHLRITALTA
jgi:hypothetical protein